MGIIKELYSILEEGENSENLLKIVISYGNIEYLFDFLDLKTFYGSNKKVDITNVWKNIVYPNNDKKEKKYPGRHIDIIKPNHAALFLVDVAFIVVVQLLIVLGYFLDGKSLGFPGRISVCVQLVILQIISCYYLCIYQNLKRNLSRFSLIVISTIFDIFKIWIFCKLIIDFTNNTVGIYEKTSNTFRKTIECIGSYKIGWKILLLQMVFVEIILIVIRYLDVFSSRIIEYFRVVELDYYLIFVLGPYLLHCILLVCLCFLVCRLYFMEILLDYAMGLLLIPIVFYICKIKEYQTVYTYYQELEELSKSAPTNIVLLNESDRRKLVKWIYRKYITLYKKSLKADNKPVFRDINANELYYVSPSFCFYFSKSYENTKILCQVDFYEDNNIEYFTADTETHIEILSKDAGSRESYEVTQYSDMMYDNLLWTEWFSETINKTYDNKQLQKKIFKNLLNYMPKNSFENYMFSILKQNRVSCSNLEIFDDFFFHIEAMLRYLIVTTMSSKHIHINDIAVNGCSLSSFGGCVDIMHKYKDSFDEPVWCFLFSTQLTNTPSIVKLIDLLYEATFIQKPKLRGWDIMMYLVSVRNRTKGHGSATYDVSDELAYYISNSLVDILSFLLVNNHFNDNFYKKMTKLGWGMIQDNNIYLITNYDSSKNIIQYTDYLEGTIIEKKGTNISYIF